MHRWYLFLIFLFIALCVVTIAMIYFDGKCPECKECVNYKKAYNENCATLSKQLAANLTADGFKAEVVHGCTAHSWVICQDCAHYPVWYDYNGEIIYKKDMYKLNNDKK